MRIRDHRLVNFLVLLALAGCGDADISSINQYLDEPDGGTGDEDTGPLEPLPAPTWDTALEPGGEHMVLDGTQSVTEDGTLRYEISLLTPVGRNGVQPNLSLRYDSRAGDGPLGIGWTLTGISSIQRCPRTGINPGPIEFSESDQLCLDGARLVALEQSSAGPGTVEYRAVPEGSDRVVQYGSMNNGYFVVTRRDGSSLRYGQNGRSVGQVPSAMANGNFANYRDTVLAWWVDSLTDVNGNTMVFNYESGFHEGFAYTVLKSVQWGDSVPSIHSRRLDITYAIRSDVAAQNYYVGGMARTMPYQMQRIDFQRFRYDFGYSSSPRTGRVRMNRVTLCGATGLLRDHVEASEGPDLAPSA